MKTTFLPLVFLLAVSCGTTEKILNSEMPEPDKLEYQGVVTTVNGDPAYPATIEVNDQKFQTNKKGEFTVTDLDSGYYSMAISVCETTSVFAFNVDYGELQPIQTFEVTSYLRDRSDCPTND